VVKAKIRKCTELSQSKCLEQGCVSKPLPSATQNQPQIAFPHVIRQQQRLMRLHGHTRWRDEATAMGQGWTCTSEKWNTDCDIRDTAKQQISD